MVLPLPSFPWQEAQFWVQSAEASAADKMPAELIIAINVKNVVRFIVPFLISRRNRFNLKHHFFSVRT